jgi:outer membrane protein TolC
LQYTNLLQRLRLYRDGLEKASRRLKLAEAIAIGLRENPSLREAHAAIQESDWTLVAIQRESWPSLRGGTSAPGVLGWTWATTSERIRAATGWNETLTLKTGQASLPSLNLNWQFFDPSRNSNIQASRSEIAARRFLFLVDARTLVMQIQQAYYALQEQYQLEQSYRQLEQQVSRLADAGIIRTDDPGQLDQLLTQRLGLLIKRISTHQRVIQAAAALAQSLGLPPGQLALPADPLSQEGVWEQPLALSLEQALRQREEIQANLATATADGWSARARQRRYLPRLSLAGQLSNPTQISTSGPLLNAAQQTDSVNQSFQTQVGIGFDWTLFDGGILAAEAEALRSRSKQGLAKADLERLRVTRQVQDNQAELINSLILIEAGADQLSVAGQSFRAAGREYLNGRGDATRVVQASNAYRDAFETYFASLRQHNSAVAALYRHVARWPEGTQDLLNSAYPGLALEPRRPVAP